MTFVTRAQKAQERGDLVRAVFILITGLKRDPFDDAGIDVLLDIVGMHASVTGLEHEIIDVISRRTDAEEIVTVLVSNLSARNQHEAVAQVLECAEAAGLDISVIDPVDEEPPAPEIPEGPRTEDTPTIDLIRDDTEKTAVAKQRDHQDDEIEDSEPSDDDIVEQPDAVDPSPESVQTSDDPDRESPQRWKSALGVVVFLAVATGGWFTFFADNGSPVEACSACESFDALIVEWPSTRAKIERLSDPSEAFAERRQFIAQLDGTAVDLDTPHTMFGVAVKGISSKTQCAKRSPPHIAIDWCRAETAPSPLERTKRLKEIVAYAPRFGPAAKALDTASSKSYNESIEQHANHTFFGRGEPSAEPPADHPYHQLLVAIQTARDGGTLDRGVVEHAIDGCTARFCALVQAVASRAFLYAGDRELAKTFAADPSQVLSTAHTHWESAEALYAWAEVHSELGDVEKVLEILNDAVEQGVEPGRAKALARRIRCYHTATCAAESPTSSAMRWWVHSDPNAAVSSKHAAPFDALATQQPAKLLTHTPQGILDDWYWDRWRLVGVSTAGQNNVEFSKRLASFRAVGHEARLLRGLAHFWQADYNNAKLYLDRDAPLSRGYLGLLHRATGDRTTGNQLLEDAGARFKRKGGAAFELGRLNASFGKRDVARDYFWQAWTQDWNQVVALQRWCDLLPPNSSKTVKEQLKALDTLPKPIAPTLIAIRDACIAKHLGSRVGDPRAQDAIDSISEVDDAWTNREIGLYLLAREQWGPANTFFDRALDIDPTDAHSLWGRAVSSSKSGQNAIAKENATRYIELWPRGSHLESAKRLLR